MEEIIIKNEEIDITPDTSLYPKIGKSGYTLTQSLAELVDNAIDERSTNLQLNINIVLQNDFIIVEDDAYGMNKAIAEKALVLGYSAKKNKLGEFGLGLKSACTSLGSKFTLKTYPSGSKFGYKYQYDEDKWSAKDSNNWMDKLGVFEKNTDKHGTSIKIENLKRHVNRQRRKDVLNDFSSRFAHFIKSGEVKIYVNQEECIPREPELTEEGKTSFERILKDGNKIYGWYGLMKKGSDKGLYGFNTIRRGRMITNYDKVGIPQHPTVSRIIGEIYLDHVPVSHNKKEFETESGEYKEAVRILEEEFKDLVKKARQTSLYAKITKEIKEKTEDFKEAIVKAFHELKEHFDIETPQKRKRSSNLEDPLGHLVIENRSSPIHHAINKILAKNERIREPKDSTQKIVSHFITIKGQTYEVIHDYESLGKDSPWKTYEYLPEKSLIIIATNTDFSAFSVTKDTPFYAAIHIAEALGEIISRVENDNSLSRAQEIKEKILRRAFEITEDFEPD